MQGSPKKNQQLYERVQVILEGSAHQVREKAYRPGTHLIRCKVDLWSKSIPTLQINQQLARPHRIRVERKRGTKNIHGQSVNIPAKAAIYKFEIEVLHKRSGWRYTGSSRLQEI